MCPDEYKNSGAVMSISKNYSLQSIKMRLKGKSSEIFAKVDVEVKTTAITIE